MKKLFTFLTKSLACFLFIFMGHSLHAQLEVEEIAPDSISVCLDHYSISVKLKNVSGAVMNNLEVMPDLPSGLFYIAGTVLNAAETDPNPNTPLFTVTTLNAGDSIYVSYDVRADCSNAGVGTPVGTVLSVGYNGNMPLIYPTDFYNFFTADLSLFVTTSVTPLPNQNIGTTLSSLNAPFRQMTIRNEGTGALDHLTITITAEPEIVYNGFLAQDGLTSIPFTQSGNVYILDLSGLLFQASSNNVGINDTLFEENEEIIIYEDFTVVSCNTGNTQYLASWGCNNQVCNSGDTDAQGTSNIDVNQGFPDVKMSIGNAIDVANYCGQDGTLTFNFQNIGTNPADFAKNFTFDIIAEEGGVPFPVGFSLSNFQINGVAVPSGVVSQVSPLQWYQPRADVTNSSGYRFDFSNNTTTTILDDLDNDGYNDDLDAGTSITLTATIHFTDIPDTVCPFKYSATFGFPQIKYESVCGTQREHNGWWDSPPPIYRAYSYPDASTLVDPITEPVDFVEGQTEEFKFCTGSWYYDYRFFDCPVDSHTAYINLPPGYHLNGTTAEWFSSSGDSIEYVATEVGNQIVIHGGGTSGININNWNGCFELNLDLVCEEGLSTSQSVISWELDYKCDTCDIIQKRACSSQLVYNHYNSCPGTVQCDGIYTMDFDATRTTLGWTDHTRTTLVDPNDPNINLNAAYPYDSIETTTSGLVLGNNYTDMFVEIKYNSTDTLLNYSGGTFYIYSGGSLTGSCPATNSTLTVSGGVYTSIFEMPCTGSIQIGDSVVFVGDWEVANSTVINNNRFYHLQSFRSKFFFTRNDTIFSCESWGEDFDLYSVQSFPLAVVQNSNNGCDNVTLELRWWNWGGTNENDFPYEFRNIGKLDSIIKVTIPDGFVYVPNSAAMHAYESMDPAVSPYFTNVGTTLITPTISGDTLMFDEDWPLIDKSGQVQINYASPPTFTLELMPTCERNDTVRTLVDFGYTYYHYADNIARHEHRTWQETWPVNSVVNPTTNLTWYQYKPNLIVDEGLITVEAFTQTVHWDIEICNQIDTEHPNIGDADNIWIDIDELLSNQGDITVTSVQQVGGSSTFNTIDYNAGTSTFVEIGALSRNQCRTYRINAQYTNCVEDEIDSLRVLVGWNCGDYPQPENAETASCHVDTSYYRLRYHTANLLLTAIDIPSGASRICDTLDYEFELTSSAPANMYDVDFWMNIPTGASIVNYEYLYPDLSNPLDWQPLPTPSTSYSGTNALGWSIVDLSEMIAVSTTIEPDDTSFVGSRHPELNRIRIRFGLALGCNSDPSNGLQMFADGITNCHDTIDLNAHYNLVIQGFENIVEYDLHHIQIDTLDCEENNTVSFTVTNLSAQNNTLGDSLRVEIPSGFTFVNGSGTPSQPLVNGSELLFSVGLIAANDSVTFTFQVESSTIFDCTPISFNAEIFKDIATNCPDPCDTVSKIWQDVFTTIYCCDPCKAEAEFIWDTVCVGEQMCFHIVDQDMANTAQYNHLWLFGDGDFSNAVEPCHTYAQEGSYIVTHIVVDFINNCADTVIHEVEVVDDAHGSIVLLGCNPFCEGDTVYLTINGEYTSIEWVNLTTGTSLGSYDTLAVTTSGTYTAVLGNGFCVDSCLSITLTAQPLPEIEIPDTMICDSSDVVTLDAGLGFTSYLWSTGDTTQTITVGPGVYWVKVGEQLQYGCCTCIGVDTVIVSVSDLEVELSDTVLCFGQSLTLMPSVTGGVPPYNYLWNTSETTSSIVVTSAGQYWVQVTDAMGCSDSDTGNVSFDYPPNPEFTYDDTICINDTTCYVAVDTGIDAWNIYNSNGVIIASFGDTNEICYHYPAVGTYTIEHIISNACGSDTATHTTVVVPPIEACIVMIGQNPFCVGDEVCLTVNDPFDQVTIIEWFRDSVSVGFFDTLCVTEPGIYQAEVHDENGCTNACMCIVLTQAPQPVINLPEMVTVCNGSPTTITAPSGFEQYVWTKDSTFYNYGDNEISVSEAGMYTLTVRDVNGCETSDTTIVNVLPSTLAVETTSTIVCRDENFNVFTLFNPNFTYSWDFKRPSDAVWTPISSSDTSYLSLNGSIMSQGGVYWFRVTVYDPISGCTSTGRVMIIHQLINCTEISLIPNPASGNYASVYYNLMGAGVQQAHFELRDMRGNIVDKIDVDPEVQQLELNIRNYASGVYQVYLFADGEFISVARLVIAN